MKHTKYIIPACFMPQVARDGGDAAVALIENLLAVIGEKNDRHAEMVEALAASAETINAAFEECGSTARVSVLDPYEDGEALWIS